MTDNKKGSKAAANKGKNAQEVSKNSKTQRTKEKQEIPQVYIKPDIQENTTGNSFKEDIAELNAKVKELGEAIGKLQSPDISQEARELVKESLENLNQIVKQATLTGLNDFKAFTDSADWRNLRETISYIAEHAEELKAALDEFQELRPFIEKEIKKPEYNGATFEELKAQGTDPVTGEVIPGSSFDKAIKAAAAAMGAKELPHINITEQGAAKVIYPTDKINNNVWKLLQGADKNGQLTFAMEKGGSNKIANAVYSINFDELKNEPGVTITKNLTAFDKRVYIATGTLFNDGYKTMTVAQIYATMGNGGRPNSKDIKKINDSITKMHAAHIYLNNTHEHSVYKKYPSFVYDASLLPMERVNAIVNGQTVNTAIHLFREPPLITFAKDRKQITTISRQLLMSPVSKTDANLQIDDYLIEEISFIKNKKGKISNKLLYTTIYEKANITTRMQRSRAKEKIFSYLEHYKKCGFIKAFKDTSDGIIIDY